LWDGKPQVTYWLGKAFWGNGIATLALTEFLRIFNTRPLYASVAKDNAASIRVLEKCGFATRFRQGVCQSPRHRDRGGIFRTGLNSGILASSKIRSPLQRYFQSTVATKFWTF
jgi:RimJ/RimL family protein N-acetyltransferase